MNRVSALVLFFLLIFTLIPQGFAASQVTTYEGLLHAIRETRAASQARITDAVEQEKVREAWETGRLIQEHILLKQDRADYGKRVIKRLSNDLGVNESDLYSMVEFAREYPIFQTSGKLTWSHYRDLLAVNDPEKRKTLEAQAEKENWSAHVLRREVRKVNRIKNTGDEKLPEVSPGPLYTYQVIRLKDSLKIDLGFGIYHDLPEKDVKKFKEGDIVYASPSLRSASGGEAISLLKDASPSDLYTYSATVTQVVDGDTFHALIDLGFETTLAQRVRLRRIDAPEILTSEGKEAKAYLEKILHRDQGRITLQSHDLDQHGRPIADVWVNGKSIDQELIDRGLAVRINE